MCSAFTLERILLFGIPAGFSAGIRGESGGEGDADAASTELGLTLDDDSVRGMCR